MHSMRVLFTLGWLALHMYPADGFLKSTRLILQRHRRILNSRSFVSASQVRSSSLQSIPKASVQMGLPHSETVTFQVAGKSFSLETGRMGRQAAGAVVARTQDTMVYATVCAEQDPTPNLDFTPLRVDYCSRYSAVGQTIGAFHRRDSRGDDNEILVARLIDRPLRPMIAEGWQHETQVLAWLLSYDKKYPPEALAICAASAALAISHVPMVSVVAGVEVGLVQGEFVVNPTRQQIKQSTLQLTIAGTKKGILMIEGEAAFLSEEQMMQALRIGHTAVAEICVGIEALQAKVGKAKKTDTLKVLPAGLVDKIEQIFGADITDAISHGAKQLRGAAVGAIEDQVMHRFVKADAPASKQQLSTGLPPSRPTTDDAAMHLMSGELDGREDRDSALAVEEPRLDTDEQLLETEAQELLTKQTIFNDKSHMSASYSAAANHITSTSVTSPVSSYHHDPVDVKIAWKKALVRKLRHLVLHTGRRSDGRAVEEIRPITIDTDLLPGAHGSALFTRGETQSLSTATLGSKSMEAKFETVDELGSNRFYLQYRFPPSSVGEVGKIGGLSRREVGHGNLAERALLPAFPAAVDFPYAVRAESLITESCGSSSMATVCGCCLAMLDAGVPLTTPVAGVAMGLILGENAGEEAVILTDILGLEDALGTMDFKVAGNETGISAFQLDIKSEGLTLDILERALAQAKKGRLDIIAQMRTALAGPRPLKDCIPKILSFHVEPEWLGKVIGPKGKTVQMLIDTHQVTNINIEDDGTIHVESFSAERNAEAQAAILKIVAEHSGAPGNASTGGHGSGVGGGGGGGFGKDRHRREGESAATELSTAALVVGNIYRQCEIKGVHAYGVFVEVVPGYEALVHVSELDTVRLSSPERGGYAVGQRIDVKYLGRNERGQGRFSRREVLIADAPPVSTVVPVHSAGAEHSVHADTQPVVDLATGALVGPTAVVPVPVPAEPVVPHVFPESVQHTQEGKKVYKRRS